MMKTMILSIFSILVVALIVGCPKGYVDQPGPSVGGVAQQKKGDVSYDVSAAQQAAVRKGRVVSYPSSAPAAAAVAAPAAAAAAPGGGVGVAPGGAVEGGVVEGGVVEGGVKDEPKPKVGGGDDGGGKLKR